MTSVAAPAQVEQNEARAGFVAAFCAYLIWGVLPVYLKQIAFADVREVLGVRILISIPAALIAVFVLSGGWTRGWADLRAAMRPRMLAALSCSAVFIFANWGLYVWLIAQGRVIEASLAYFLAPLTTVAMGVAFFNERTNKLQIAALATAAFGVLVQGVAVGAPPWAALGICASWSVYTFIRKRAPVQAGAGLFVETTVLAPVAAGLLFWVSIQAPLSFTHSLREGALLSLAGPATALPLMLFAFAARRITLTTLGLLQYLAPTLQFLTGLAYGEPFTPLRAASFGLIWLGLILFTSDAIRRARTA